jgi:serine-type D-Ala-D-Ala carboxypeptidase (penicillin-binding protein 5/6)
MNVRTSHPNEKRTLCTGGNLRVLYGVFFSVLSVSLLLPSSVPATVIQSRAAVVLEISTGKILYAKNPNRMLPPASTTKLMTALVVMDRLRLSDAVAISEHVTRTPPTRAGFKKGDRVTVEALLYAALMRSANDAAEALAEAAAGSEDYFVQMMNEKALAIGARNTRFINPHGLPGPGQYTTALDLSKIMEHAVTFPKLREILGTPLAEVQTERGASLLIKNTDKLLGGDCDLIGGKTGFTQSARHCFVAAAERDRKTIIVTLLGSPSRRSLWKETHELVDKGFQIIGARKSP